MGDKVWEPGAPSLRALGPSIVGGAIVPLLVYHLVKGHVHGDAVALSIAGVPAAAWVGGRWVQTRRIDPIASISLLGFVLGVGASAAMGGDAFVLKVRDSAFTTVFGVACLLSLRAARPVMFHLGKALSAGDDAARRAAYDELYELPDAPAAFATITVVWGVGFLFEALARVLLAESLTTSSFLVVTPLVQLGAFSAMFAFTVAWTRRAKRLGLQAGLVLPSAP